MSKATVILAALLLAAPALAETTTGAAVPDGEIDELFDDVRKVAGSRLVTLRIGPFGNAPFVPGNVRVIAPAGKSVICVRAVSRDGLYAMQEPYSVTEPGDFVSLVPFSDKYADRLDDYPSEDIAVFAFAAPDATCQERDATVLPVVSTDPLENQQIQALVNSRNRKVSVVLHAEGAAPIDLSCEKPRDEARITHDQDCRGQIRPDFPLGRAELRVTLDDGLVRQTDRYAVILGSAGP